MIIILPPLFLPPEHYFQVIREAELAVIDTSIKFDKRMKDVHRTVLSGQHGPEYVTVPICHPKTSRCAWNDVRISPHGQWWRNLSLKMATLYGPTPFFDFYRHDFLETVNERAVGRSVTDFDIDLILTVNRLSGITTPLSVELDTRWAGRSQTEIQDLRHHDFYGNGTERSAIEQLFMKGSI